MNITVFLKKQYFSKNNKIKYYLKDNKLMILLKILIYYKNIMMDSYKEYQIIIDKMNNI